jgi:hypothetical protein
VSRQNAAITEALRNRVIACPPRRSLAAVSYFRLPASVEPGVKVQRSVKVAEYLRGLRAKALDDRGDVTTNVSISLAMSSLIRICLLALR